MTAPQLAAQIQGQGTVSADNLNTYIQNCTNIALLRSFVGLPGMCVFIDGSVTPNDGGAGPFYWNTTSIGPDNNSTVIVPQPGVPGAWIRLSISETSPVNIANIAALRAFDGGAASTVVYVEGYYTPGDGGAGTFVFIPGDTTSTDNGGTIIIDAANNRYYRETSDQSYSVMWFGAKANGSTDDTSAINSALSAASSGQEVWLSERGQHLVSSGNINVSPGVILRGAWNGGGSITLLHPAGNSFNLSGLNSAIILNPSYSVILGAASQIRGVPIYREGLVIPVTDSSAFAGTAILGQGDDNYIGYCMILGFNAGIIITNVDRTRIEWVQADNQNGIVISTEYDTTMVENCHLWPFCSYVSGGGANAGYTRSGVGFSLSGCALPVLSNNFAFAYFTDFLIVNCGGPTVVNCQADGISGFSGTTCFFIGNGTTDDTSGKFIGCTAFSLQSGYTVDLPVDDFVEFIGCSSSSQVSSWNIVQGDARIIGGAIDVTTTGINVESVDLTVIITDLRAEGISNVLINNTGGSSTIIVRDLDLSQFSPGQTISTNMDNYIVSSSGTINLPSIGYFFNISGTTPITQIVGGWVGRQITLLFLGSLTVNNGNGSGLLRLNGSTNFSAVAGSTLSFVSNGTQWYQTGGST